MQDDELKDFQRRLRETRQLAEENHELLNKIHRSIVWGRILRAVYWVIFLGAAIGAFYFLEPYWDSVREIYQNLQGQFEAFSNFSN